jgi:hypothetical protein
MRAVTPQQVLALYEKPSDGDRAALAGAGTVCLGGGVILSRGPSYHRRSAELPEELVNWDVH